MPVFTGMTNFHFCLKRGISTIPKMVINYGANIPK